MTRNQFVTTRSKPSVTVIGTAACALFCTPAITSSEKPHNEGYYLTSVQTVTPDNLDLFIDPHAEKWYKFQELVRQWRDERGAMSSITEMSILPAYQKIIGMGPPAIPLIIAQLKSEGDDPDQWFWALRAITDTNPVNAEDQGD